jgi:hypothetical protein
MTYFHIRTYTIIGAKSFHCPVRDGKEWGQLAMVVRHNWRRSLAAGFQGLATDIDLEEVKCGLDCYAMDSVFDVGFTLHPLPLSLHLLRT